MLDELRELIPLAPLHQPYNLAAIEAVAERLPDVPQVACFDTSFHRGQPAVAELVPLPREICEAGVQRYGFHGLSYEYIASVLPQVAPEIAERPRHRRAPRQRREPVRAEERQERRQHARLHRARRPLHGHAAGRARSRRRAVPLPEPRALAPRKSKRCSTRSPACSASPASATTCATCSSSDEPDGAPGGGLLRLPRRQGDRRAGRRARRHRRRWSSPPASARTRPRFAGASARLRLARHRPRRQTRTRAAARASLAPASRVSAWVIPTNEELMIARHTAALLGLGVARSAAA